ncbi:hypothetical protein PHISCL_04921 [Aspergillus sclerotialis]|uniref:AAA+ ATPase domain-containing protein n=1 Tax=Aspergillus sclerotialis TaxID=2070753 RepID=A0A3A2ZI11_9EURO|nr:hypothetical protein PHISCL_04921 [Aspergillus sclerotialis]
MAMGQPRAIHPFFQKGHLFLPLSGQFYSSPVDYGTLATSTSNDTVDGTTNRRCAQNDGPHSNNSGEADSPPTAMLDHDPNSSRRKRRKTKEHTEFGPIENFLGVDCSGNGSALPDHTSNAEPHASTVEGVNPVQESQPSELRTAIGELPGSDPGDSTASNGLSGGRYRKRRTLKLNANGKLLSSPTSSGAEERPQRKGKGKARKSAGLKIKHDEKSLVVIKYATENGNKERVGKLIDGIINGRIKHEAPVRPTIPTTIRSEPPKPTHPFFLKKPTRNSDTFEASPHVCSTSTVGRSQDEGAHDTPLIPRNKSTAALEKPFSSFKPRAKFPEPVNALWPPRGLVHVKGFDTVDNKLSSSPSSLSMDQKKSKMAAIRINDQENVLLSCYIDAQRSQSDQAAKTLRIPGRSTAPGRTLQKALSKQFSEASSGANPDNSCPLESCHPAIRKLSSSMQTSLTAFDRGDFETSLWAQKYAPCSADEVLQIGREPLMLRDWLKELMISAVDTGKQSTDRSRSKKDGKRRQAKKRKMAKELDGFIVSSGSESSEMGQLSDSDEDELAGDVTVSAKRTVMRTGDLGFGTGGAGEKRQVSNVILLSGPSGCGKTASVYAVANELDFEIFEINPGSRRTSRDILERVGDMTQNHLVNNLNGRDDLPITDEAKRSKMRSFFKSPSEKRVAQNEVDNEVDPKQTRHQKQSLILLEEADLLFEEDKQFWSGVMTLICQSKRPIVITCNDESLIPLQDISFHAILRFRAPPQDLAVDYLLLVAGNEGHMLGRNAVDALWTAYRKDLRKALTDLNFWCQMGIGSDKSGLDWIMDRSRPGSDLDKEGNQLRVLSLNTYRHFMGWLSRDMTYDSSLNSQIESSKESLHWWNLSIQDSESMTDSTQLQTAYLTPESFASKSNSERLDELRQVSEYVDMRSDLDILCSSCSTGQNQDTVDISTPPMSEKQRASYIEGYPLLHADLESDYTLLSASIGSTLGVLMRRATQPTAEINAESLQAPLVLANVAKSSATTPSAASALAAFEPIMQANYVFPLPTGRLAPSFENGLGPLFEDLAPYIRAIVAFDLRLEKHRIQLSGLLSQGSTGAKRVRTTRASRAALEGGNKSYTRKERWFPPDMNPAQVLATGNREWQDRLLQLGYFGVGTTGETVRGGEADNSTSSDSSGEGGI